MDYQEKVPPCTIVLAALNVVVYVLLTLGGDTEDALYMLEKGAVYLPSIAAGEYYRILTSMFMHFGFMHLANNIFMLLILGRYAEKAIGKIKFVLIYLIGGITGNLLSLAVEWGNGDYSVSAGASGAVFAILGALIWMAIKGRGYISGLTSQGLLFMAFISLYNGLANGGINNYAHLGGIAGGFLAALFLYRKKDTREGSMPRSGDNI